jgi:transposase
VRIPKLLRSLLALGKAVVFIDWEHNEETETTRAELRVWIRQKVRKKGCCGRCGERCAWGDHGGGERTWHHVDVGFATSTLVALARRVKCPTHGVTVARVPWAWHDSAFTRSFEDLIVYDAIASSKANAAARYPVSWRAVNNACVRVATEALGRIDLLCGLTAVAIDEVKYKKGHRYLMVVCSHTTAKVIWAANRGAPKRRWKPSSSPWAKSGPTPWTSSPATGPNGSTPWWPRRPRTPPSAWTPFT